jgi:hypothetical protein
MELMNKNETAKYLRISVGDVNRRLARGELIATKIGGLVFSVKKLSTSLSETVSARDADKLGDAGRITGLQA